MSAPRDGRFLTLPNVLSMSRIPLGGVFWAALAQGPGRAELPFAVLTAAAVTDVLDGYLARRRGVDASGVGSWLDPICDKVFVAAVLAALYVQRHVSLAILALIVTRELLQLPMVVIYRASGTLRRWLNYDFRASFLGKGATVLQFLAVSALILQHAAARRLAQLAFVLGVLALGDYIRRAILLGKTHPPDQELDR